MGQQQVVAAPALAGAKTAKRRQQRGAVLFLALIALVAMTIAALALVRAVDTANVVSGNFAFKQATLQLIDFGIEAAAADLPGVLATPEAVAPAGCTTTCSYYPKMAVSTYGNGRPKQAEVASTVYTIDWDNVPTTLAAPPVSGYTVQYVIERLCNDVPVGVASDIPVKCLSRVLLEGKDYGASGGAKLAWEYATYFRITVRVRGPRGAESYGQAIFDRHTPL